MREPKLRFKADDGTEFPEWEERRLGDICTINPTTNKLAETFYYIDLDSVTDGKLTLKDAICKENAPSRAQRVLSDNDVLFQSVRPYQKNHYYFKDTFDEQVVASTGYCQLRMKNGDNRFLYQLLYTDSVSEEVDKRCTGSNYPAINSNSLSKIKVYVPSSTIEQKRIAACLSTLDHVINQTQSEIDAWEKQKRGVMQLLFGQKVRFKADDGSEFPEWEEKSLGEIFDVVTDYVAAGSFADIAQNVKYLSSGFAQLVRTVDLKNGFTSKDPVYVDENAYKYLWRVWLNREGIILPNVGNCGEVYYFIPEDLPYENCALAPNAILVRSATENNQFMAYRMKASDFQNKLKLIVSPSGQTKFNKTEFKGLTITIPSFTEQNKIAVCLSAFDTVIDKAKQELAAYRELKKGLLQQMFV